MTHGEIGFERMARGRRLTKSWALCGNWKENSVCRPCQENDVNTSHFFCINRSTVVDCEAHVIAGHRYDAVSCPVNPRHSTTVPVFGPITIDPNEGDTSECLWTFMSDCLLSEAVVEEMRAVGISGFETADVLMSAPSRLGATYKQIRPIGWGGIASPASGITVTSRCDACLHTTYSSLLYPDKLFDATQWDGSDVFMIWPMPKFIFVASRVADLLKELHVKGLELVEIDDLEIPKYGFTVGQLSHHMPPELARRIGTPLSIE